MRRTLSLFALTGAVLFFACDDSGSDGGLSGPSTGGSGGAQAGSSQAGSSQAGNAQAGSSQTSGSGGTSAGAGGSEGGQGGAGAGGGLAETTDELCNDGKDNDGNGFADCEDFNCATGPGITVCGQAGGNGGSSGSGGSSGTGGDGGSAGSSSGAENTAALCTDGQDNDGDKFTDCDDFDCCVHVNCKEVAPESSCAKKGSGGSGGGSPENTVEACTDKVDNDGDKFVDCNDFDCCKVVDCAKLDPTSSCAKQGTTTPENTVEACTDKVDNDGDKFVDCNDFDCCKVVDCKTLAPESSCAKQGTGGSGGSSGTPENTVAACTDKVDNDGDKFIDCDDFDCCALVDCKTIDPESSCAKKGTGGSSGTPENTVAACTDKVDNDGDKFVDCDDFDCCAVVDCKTLAPESSCAKQGTGGSGGSSGVKENTVELCSDKVDNDGDKFIDCDDFDCCAVVDCKTIAPNSACGKKAQLPRGSGASPSLVRLDAEARGEGALAPEFLLLAAPRGEHVDVVAQQQRHPEQLLQDVDDPLPVRGRLHPALIIELLPRLGDRALVRDGEHPHPAPQDAHLVHRVEGLAPSAHFQQRQRPPLRGAHGSLRERKPVDLVLEHRGHRPVLLGRDPDVGL
jgi:hypothetical protein